MSLRAENPRYRETTVYSPIFCHHTRKLLVGQALLLSHRTHSCVGMWHTSPSVWGGSGCRCACLGKPGRSAPAFLGPSPHPSRLLDCPGGILRHQLARILLPCDPPKAVWGRSMCRIEKLWSGSLGPGPAPPQPEAPARHLPTHTSLWILPPLLGFLTIFRLDPQNFASLSLLLRGDRASSRCSLSGGRSLFFAEIV